MELWNEHLFQNKESLLLNQDLPLTVGTWPRTKPLGLRKERNEMNPSDSFCSKILWFSDSTSLLFFILSYFKLVPPICLNYSEYGMPLISSRCKQLMEAEDISNTADTSGKNKELSLN